MVGVSFLTGHAKTEKPVANRLVVEVNLADRQMVGDIPIRVHPAQQFRSERLSFYLDVSQLNHSLTFRSRKALLMTETELMLIAAPAMIGLSSKPKKG